VNARFGELIPRRALELAGESLADFRVFVVHGARQVGKTTLAKALATRIDATYVLVIDEIQRVGEPMVLSIKVVVDNDNRPGRYILTGSTNFLTVPTISESLAGRVNIVTLWPFSRGELTGGSDGFVDRVFDEPGNLLFHVGPTPDRDEYFEALCVGGYPAVQRLGRRSRRTWFGQYIDTVLRREVEVADDLRRFDALARRVRYFAATSGQELVISPRPRSVSSTGCPPGAGTSRRKW
jgi:predicted AAA+ superfamily ATPase